MKKYKVSVRTDNQKIIIGWFYTSCYNLAQRMATVVAIGMGHNVLGHTIDYDTTQG